MSGECEGSVVITSGETLIHDEHTGNIVLSVESSIWTAELLWVRHYGRQRPLCVRRIGRLSVIVVKEIVTATTVINQYWYWWTSTAACQSWVFSAG